MKKLLYILLALPLFFFASCSDDDNDLPDFKVKVDISGQSEVTENGVIVIPSGNQFSIDAISIVESDAKEIAIGGVSYYWDYILLDASNIIPPYGITFNTTGIPEGDHILQIYMPIFAVGYSPAEALLTYRVKIVAPAEDETPDDSGSTTTITATPKVTQK
ncbi:MAG: hypothetical protein NC248_02590 [Bacteroides sp.]|nr:hypothetical protein [Lachnospiraceae bacterium]MCM1331477.1 hypothetical protein [Bacteroides sp.]MCM1389530.1 hypothetical protein [Bacteroides sp.]